MYRYIRKNNEQTIQRNAKQYTGATCKYAVDDLVWAFTKRRVPGKPQKITSSWTGPYSVVSMPSDVLVNIRPMNNAKGKQVTKHVTCIRRYTGVQTSSGDTASTEGLVEDDPLVEEIGGEETPVVHVEIPVHHQEPQARIVDKPEVVTSQVALPPPQSRKRNKAPDVTLGTSEGTSEQATARAERAARRAGRSEGQNKQRTAKANSAETARAEADREDRERADTEAVTEPELNTAARNSSASEVVRTPTRKKRGRLTLAKDTSDTEREVIAKRD